MLGSKKSDGADADRVENGVALFTGKRVAQNRQNLGVAALSRELDRRDARDVVDAVEPTGSDLIATVDCHSRFSLS